MSDAEGTARRSTGGSSSIAPSTVPAGGVRVLVTNDDGVDAPGISYLANALGTRVRRDGCRARVATGAAPGPGSAASTRSPGSRCGASTSVACGRSPSMARQGWP